jgi:cell division protease FtsH
LTQQFYKNMALWLVILLLIVLLVSMLRQKEQAPAEMPFTAFLERVESGEVISVLIDEGRIEGKLSGEPDNRFVTNAPPNAVTYEFVQNLDESGVEVVAEPKRESPVWQQMLIMWFPFLLLIGLWVFFVRQMQSGGGKAMSFGKSRARLLNESHNRITFGDVAGVEESKAELEEIIEFLRDPKKFTRLGGRIPKGVLLVGPPGTGKTLLARAVAGEAGVPFFSISGSDFVEMFVGVGASRVRDLFLQGKKNAPCIIFIDEIDAVGRHRGAGLGGGHDEREQTLNQLLVEMDGFESNEGVILVAATNRPDVLDPALLRPGRFDRRVVVPRHLEIVAKGTPGFVGADLQNLVNEAALLAARHDALRVAMDDFERARDKVLLGAERRSMVMTDTDKRITAYHEAGHALVAMLTEDSDPVHKVTIIPRGMALGVTQTLPPEDRYNLTHNQIRAMIKHSMGGRAAEELVFDHLSTGASNDLQQATQLARQMVCRYGMSEKLGPVSYEDDEHDVFLGRDFMQAKGYSEKKAEEIDEEVSLVLNGLYDESKALLDDNRELLDRVAESLLERETLDTADLRTLMAGEELPPMEAPDADQAQDSETPSDSKPIDFGGKKLPDPEPMPS